VIVTLMKINESLFQEINASAGAYSWLDALMIFCANSLIFCFPLILVMLWGRPLSWRKHQLLPEEAALLQQRRSVVLWVGIACLGAYGLNLLIEQLVFEPRPFVNHHVHLLIAHTADASFPSDHTAWACAVVGMLLFQQIPTFIHARHRPREGQGRMQRNAFLLPLFLLVLSLLMACCIGFARIFVGVHYPGDVLGGGFDGLLAASVVTLFSRWLQPPTVIVLRFAHSLRLA
jgi:undecaprenyl-diphosphatase